MQDSHRWIQRHWRRLQWGQFLGVSADYLAMCLVGLGSAILLVKLFLPQLWPHALWLGLALCLVPFLAWRKVQRVRFTRTEATALLDRKLQAGGLLMTLSEAPDDQWQQHLPRVEHLWRESLPKVRPRRFASLVTVPLAFAVASCFIPLRENTPLQATPRKVAQQTTDQLEAILKTLEEADVLKEEEKEALRKEIEKFAEETHQQPLTHEQWETADSLKQQLQMSWERNERSLESASQALEQLLSALANQGEMSADQLQQLENSLGQNLQSLAQKAGQGKLGDLSEGLLDKLNQLAQSGKLDLPENAEQRQKMLDELKQKLQEESEKLAKQRSECQGLCEGGNCPGGQCQGEGQCEGNKPGQGGVTRGRGDAPMIWGAESDLANTKFKEIVLPPGTLDDPSEQILGLTYKEPEVNVAETAPRGELRETDPSAGRATWDRKLNPRHRETVRKFFNAERKAQSIPADGGL
ncbi:MAG: hypothetical protein R3C12_24135 [Planctomycetaceae bacterium]|nr:hypothetical protein [Planctomycetaceae bacterium]